MKQGVIFDMDGVLVHTDRFHYLAWKRLADAKGIPFDETVNRRLRGLSREASLDIILEGWPGTAFSEAEKAALCAEKNEICRGYLSAMTPDDVAPKVRETLAALRQRGCLLAVGSSSKNAKLVLNRTGLTEAFDAISDGTNITRAKPDPEVFLKAAELLGLSPADCAVVEDAEAGIDAARAGGFFAVGLGDAAEYAKTDYPLRDFSELLKL